jgi:hypothetical protein
MSLSTLLDWPPAVAKRVKGVFRGHPEPRQRAAPSALLLDDERIFQVLLKPGEGLRPRTPAHLRVVVR